MPKMVTDHEAREETAHRIVSFLKTFYLSIQTEELRESFTVIEREMFEFLLSQKEDLHLSAKWIDELFENAPKNGGAVNLAIDVVTAPELIGTLFSILANKASLGSENKIIGRFVPVVESQLNPTRADAMRALIMESFSSPITALEIGTWFGVGSTQIWLSSLPSGSSLFLVDAWRSYVTNEDKASDTYLSFRAMDLLPQAALTSTIREVFKNEASNQSNIEIITMRGKSSKVMEFFREDSFDFIYLDGSHYYADIKQDIVLAKQLSRRQFSVICGDDLESLNPLMIEAARQNPNRDFITVNGVGFHPGVTRAVSEEFERVNLASGFWWVYRRDGVWGV